MSKIFGIGLSRTGTLSLAYALKELGYKTIHFPNPLAQIEDYDAAVDSPVAAYYKELDLMYPGSKFIFTYRLTKWLASVNALFETHYQDFDEYIHKIHRKLYKAEYPGDSTFIRAYFNHFSDVVDYFKDREDDIIYMDICRGEGWEILCPFLGKPIPNTPFPHMNERKFLYEDGVWIRELTPGV